VASTKVIGEKSAYAAGGTCPADQPRMAASIS
jgi:hypothetical protein